MNSELDELVRARRVVEAARGWVLEMRHDFMGCRQLPCRLCAALAVFDLDRNAGDLSHSDWNAALGDRERLRGARRRLHGPGIGHSGVEAIHDYVAADDAEVVCPATGGPHNLNRDGVCPECDEVVTLP